MGPQASDILNDKAYQSQDLQATETERKRWHIKSTAKGGGTTLFSSTRGQPGASVSLPPPPSGLWRTAKAD